MKLRTNSNRSKKRQWAERPRLRAALALSSLYVVAAVWVWVAASGQIETSADTVVIPQGQTVSLVSTYSSQQQDCVRQKLGEPRFTMLLKSQATTLTESESATIQECLVTYPLK